VTYRPRYTPEAAAKIRKLHPEIKQRVRAAIDRLVSAPFQGHSLHGELVGLRSLRVGKYRIIYSINDEDTTLDIFLVGPRRDIYEELRKHLMR